MAKALVEPMVEVAGLGRIERVARRAGAEDVADRVRREVDRLALDPDDRDDEEDELALAGPSRRGTSRIHQASGRTTIGVKRSTSSWAVKPCGGPTEALRTGGTSRKNASAAA